MFRIGLTGGIAAGKSAAASRFASLGLTVIDHDLLAREAVAPGSVGLARIAEEFGSQVLADDGSLDRPRLGSIVFANRDRLDALNAIVHPEVLSLAQQAETKAGAIDPNAIVVHDIPLLIETGQQHDFDALVVVMTDEQTRLDRLVTGRGLSLTEAQRRIAAQTTDSERLKYASTVLDGAGDLAHLNSQIDALVAKIRENQCL